MLLFMRWFLRCSQIFLCLCYWWFHLSSVSISDESALDLISRLKAIQSKVTNKLTVRNFLNGFAAMQRTSNPQVFSIFEQIFKFRLFQWLLTFERCSNHFGEIAHGPFNAWLWSYSQNWNAFSLLSPKELHGLLCGTIINFNLILVIFYSLIWFESRCYTKCKFKYNR